jgi:ATP-dependent Lon protease
MEDVPKEIQKDIKFHYVDTYEDVAKIVFKSWPPKKSVK